MKTSPKRSYSVIDNERFGLVFAKTVSIISATWVCGTGLFVTPKQITQTKKHHMVTLIQLRTAAQTFPYLQAQPADKYTGTATDNLGLSFWRLIFHHALFLLLGGGWCIQSEGSKDDIECHPLFSINLLPLSKFNNRKLSLSWHSSWRMVEYFYYITAAENSISSQLGNSS